MNQYITFIFYGFAALYGLFLTIAFFTNILYKNIRKKNYTGGVTVIVCARNELNNLKKLIPILLNQTFPEFEIIIVDDRSEDGQYDYLLNLANEKKIKHVRIEQVPDHIQPKKYAITLGVRAAKHDVLLFTDADCIPESQNWITEMTAPFSNEQISFSLGYSPYLAQKGFLNTIIRWDTIQTAFQYITLTQLGKPYMGVGRNMAYRKDIFLNNRGFGAYQSVIGGDDDLFVNMHATRRNTKLVLGKEALVYSVPKTTWAEFMIQKVRHLSVGRYYKWSDQFILGLAGLSKFLMYAFLFAAILAGFQPLTVLSVYIGTLVLLLMNIIVVQSKTGESKKLWWAVLLDLFYLFVYLIIATKAKFSPKIRWR